MKDAKLPEGVRVPSIDALNYALAVGNEGFAVVLKGGVMSQKTIERDGDVYLVTHHIDGSEQMLTKEKLEDERLTSIGRAMKAGSFVTFD